MYYGISEETIETLAKNSGETVSAIKADIKNYNENEAEYTEENEEDFAFDNMLEVG